MTQKTYLTIKNYFNYNTFKVGLPYLFNAFLLFKMFLNLKLNFILGIDQKLHYLKNLKENKKTVKKFLENHFSGWLKLTQVFLTFFKTWNNSGQF